MTKRKKARRIETVRFLHLHSTFAAGGKELRCVQLINAFGPNVHHDIVSENRAETGAMQQIAPFNTATIVKDFPSLVGKPLPGRLAKIAMAMRGYDLVLTYNWGAMDAVMAHTVMGQKLGLPPLIHHEDGFNEDERTRIKWSRNMFRKIALGRTSKLVVPSERLEAIALEKWDQPIGRVMRIPNGIELKGYARTPEPDAIPGLEKRETDRWVGTLAGLRPVKNLPRLVAAFAALPEDWQLVIVGEGTERRAIEKAAEQHGVTSRVHLTGFVPYPAQYVGLFDIFALSSDSEQMPVSVIEAMAAGLPVAATDVGDIADMVSDENRPLIGDPEAALRTLADDAELRSRIGSANRAAAEKRFDAKRMVDAYRRLYLSAMQRESMP
ncbi:glycosyltransferase [Qipengyuania sp. JC766]|uniref:glycosyltransferase n=1 Tax=Qipengyuania sp. JC766 TaxID=3232139 RepID=UPI003459E7CA